LNSVIPLSTFIEKRQQKFHNKLGIGLTRKKLTKNIRLGFAGRTETAYSHEIVPETNQLL
jgi:hypothetical protein